MVSAVCNVVYLLLRHKNKQTQGEEHKGTRMINQCSDCGGFCKKSGCERENVKPTIRKNIKELTDEEILEIASPMFEDTRYPSTALDFARAILRKAQEK